MIRLFTRGEDPDAYDYPFDGDERVAAGLRHENENYVWSPWVARQTIKERARQALEQRIEGGR